MMKLCHIHQHMQLWVAGSTHRCKTCHFHGKFLLTWTLLIAKPWGLSKSCESWAVCGCWLSGQDSAEEQLRLPQLWALGLGSSVSSTQLYRYTHGGLVYPEAVKTMWNRVNETTSLCFQWGVLVPVFLFGDNFPSEYIAWILSMDLSQSIHI